MAERLSILDRIREGRFEASLITTYNAYLPYYEEVVLPALLGAGSRHNVVLMDAGDCARAFAGVSTRPREAGREYALLPVRAPGAFHPKIILLAGRERGCVLVGSHNLTISGFGNNRELTTCFAFQAGAGSDGEAIARQALALAGQWTRDLPPEARRSVRAMEQTVPWLSKGGVEQAGLLATTSDGVSLWKQLRSEIQGKAVRVAVVGPFFDEGLGFLRAIVRDLAPREVVVGIDPKTVVIDRNVARKLSKVRFVNLRSLGGDAGYFHAKALYIDCGRSGKWVVAGSANPSAPAWLADGKARNIEAVVVRADPDGRLAEGLGLAALFGARDLSKEDWQGIAESQARESTPETRSTPVAIAIATPGGFEIGPSDMPATLTGCRLLDARGAPIESSERKPVLQKRWRVAVPSVRAIRETAVLELSTSRKATMFALVHHPGELEARWQSDSQRQVRSALESLSKGVPQIEGLLKLVEKVIFAPQPPVRPEPGPRPTGKGQRETGRESLEDSEENGVKGRGHGTGARSDLGLLVDALIHRLGQGLGPEERIDATENVESGDWGCPGSVDSSSTPPFPSKRR